MKTQTFKADKIPISATLIAMNEEMNIARAIASLSWADEVLVYDSGSTDGTIAIAEKMGAKVVNGPWLGFGPTKKKAAELAANDWILSLDCDEEVSDELAREVSARLGSLRADVAYSMPRLSWYLGRWIRYGGWYPDYQIRLFNRKNSQWSDAGIHEKVQATHYEKMAGCLNHYVFRDIAHQVQTNNRYSSLQAAQMLADGRRFSWFHFFTKPYVKFIECYVWKLGFLDAWPGYLIARNAAYSVLLKWAKLKELEGSK